MYIATLIVLILVGVALLGILALSFTRRFTERAAYKFANTVGIGLTEGFLPLVRSQLVLQQRVTSIAGLLSLLAAIALLLNDPALAGSTLSSLTFAGIAISGMSVGNVATALSSHIPRDPDQPRLARARAVTVADYVAPLERRSAYVAVALAVAATTSFLVASGTTRLGPLSWISAPVILAALSVVSLVLFELAGPRIVRAGQPAGSPIELAWDDALRAARLRSLVLAPMTLGAYGTLASITLTSAMTAAHTVPWPVTITLDIATIAFVLAVLVTAIIAAITKPQRFFLRRLWPNADAVA